MQESRCCILSIKQKVDFLCKKYETRNPFEIAKQLDIQIIIEPLGSIKGYYSSSYRIKFIHINQDLPSDIQRQVCAHELGHAILHPKCNTPFLRANTLFFIDKLEKEANYFMALLLYPAKKILEYAANGNTIYQIAATLQLTPELVEYIINNK